MKSAKHAITLIFILLGFLIYSNVLYGPFILDDTQYIEDNYPLQNLSNLLKDFSGTRYIGFLSFALNYYFGGLNTFGYHIVNVLIHIINAFLVYLLVQITVNNLKSNAHSLSPIASRLLPIACSLIFLTHPIQTQAVSYITQRFTSLATLFYLLSLVLYVKARVIQIENGEGRRAQFFVLYILSVLSTILAMKTKEISFTLPFVIALYEWTFFSRNGLKTRVSYLFPFFFTLSIIPITLLWPKHADTILAANIDAIDAGEMLREWQLRDIKDIPVYNYFITQFRVIVTYIRLLFFPVNQTFEYDYPLSKSLFEPATFISFIFLLMIFSFAVYIYFRSRITHHAHGLLISFGILWFFITLSVESSIVPIKDVIFEHRLYLPSVGFILSAATALFYGAGHLEKRLDKPLYNYILVIIIIAAVILSFSTYRRNILWGDKYLMYLDNVNKAPNRATPHNNLGVVYFNQGRMDEAIKEYVTAIRLKPDHINGHYNLGLAHSNQGRADEAIKEYLTALKLQPDIADAHNNLGLVYYNQGRLDEAIKEYVTAIRLKPDHPDIHYNLGLAYYNQGRIDETIKEYLTAIRLKPDSADAHYNLGVAYSKQGRFDGEIKEFLTVIKLKPDSATAHYNLGVAYYNQGRRDEAIKEYLTALKLQPDIADAHNNLGLVYYNQGRLDEAIKEYLIALKLQHGIADVYYNLGLVYKAKGFKNEAKKEFEAVLKLNSNDAAARQAIKSLGK